MDNMEHRAQNIQDLVLRWLDDDQGFLTQAVSETMRHSYFRPCDISHSIDHWRTVLTSGQLTQWTSRIERTLKGETDRSLNVLCLHAGNLPLVGLQDTLATLVAGYRYFGKLSRKDPWLMSSLLKYLTMNGVPNIHYSTNLFEFSGRHFDYWMFAGSESSLSDLAQLLTDNGMITDATYRLMRTAHFSVAYIPDPDNLDYRQLIEAIMRYEGKGCRSVAIVYSNVSLDAVHDRLKHYVDEWVTNNKVDNKTTKRLLFRGAYNAAVGASQWVSEHLIVQEGVPLPDLPGIVYWQPITNFKSQLAGFGNSIQQIYFGRGSETPEIEFRKELLEPLSKAQNPDLDWMPDGTDVLHWLTNVKLTNVNNA